MASVSELRAIYEESEDVARAAEALDLLVEMGPPDDLPVGDCYDGLATDAAESDDFALAARMQRRALEHGCQYAKIGEDMFAWYLLKAGEREKGEAEFARLREKRAGDPGVVSILANARLDSGDPDGALEAYDEALDLAKSLGDPGQVHEIRGERRSCRWEQDLPLDEEDRIDLTARSSHGLEMRYALAWFPRDQIDAALARWPSLAGDLRDADAYCKTIEARLRDVLSTTGKQPVVSPLNVERLVEFAAERNLDPDSGEARSELAAEIGDGEQAVRWPPGRNEPCWCGSGRKYKRCCG